MSAQPLLKFEVQTAAELAEYLRAATSWREVEALAQHYPHWKREAWKLLSEAEQERIKYLKHWQDHPVAQKFPPGSLVRRINSTTESVGKVMHYWSAYGVDYVTFQVGPDIDWCRASFLQLVNTEKSTAY